MLNKNRSIFNKGFKKINYTFLPPSLKKFRYNKSVTQNNIPMESNHINISIDPQSFDSKKSIESLNRTNGKWFINLSNTYIPQEVSAISFTVWGQVLPTILLEQKNSNT